MPVNNVKLGKDVRIPEPGIVNLFGCSIGDETKIGAFVEIGRNVVVGARCKIGAQAFLCEGVTVEDEVFIGPGVKFINDRNPRATTNGHIQTDADWTIEPTTVRKGASIGCGCIVMCGITIGERAMIAAGAVVTRDVPADTVVAGVPARFMRGTTRSSTAKTKKPAKRAKAAKKAAKRAAKSPAKKATRRKGR